MRTERPAFRAPRAAHLSPLAAALALAFGTPATGATITVTSNADSGPGTLRQAILDANSACGTDPSPLINFSGGPFTISPSSELPGFVCFFGPYSPTVDGGGSHLSANIVLDGSASGAACGLKVSDGGYGGVLSVLGMRIQGFQAQAFSAAVCGTVRARGNILTGNTIGALLANSNGGMPELGGPAAADRNVVTNNTWRGVYVTEPSLVQNNWIGTANGTSASGNETGIYVSAHPSSILDNVVSGNTLDGIFVYADYGGTLVAANLVGVNAANTAALPNGGAGVSFQYSQSGFIDANVIAGNGGAGVYIDGSSFVDVHDNQIGVGFANNYGVDAYCSGYLSLIDNVINNNTLEGVRFNNVEGSILNGGEVSGNGHHGVRVDDDLGCNSGSSNSISPDGIVGNGMNGVLLVGGNDNSVIPLAIHGNSLKNININRSPGTTALPNDPGDSDGGPNGQQNWPVIDSVTQAAGETVIEFTLDTTPGTFDIRFYANSALGKPAGEVYLGNTFISTYGGPVSGSFAFGGLADNISATATSPSGSTSELSTMKAALTAPAVTVSQTTVNFGAVQLGQSSAERTVTLRSIGDQPWIIDDINSDGFCYGTPICYGGAFICSTTCETGTEYAKGSICTLKATFAPFFPGFQSTTVQFCDNTSSGQTEIVLQGDAVLPPPLTISPTLWDFGGVPVGEASDVKLFTVRANLDDYGGSIPIIVEATGEFDVVSDTCDGSVSNESPCHIGVVFGPTAAGESRGELRVSIFDVPKSGGAAKFTLPSPTAKATLIGTGISGGELALPSSIDLGAVVVGGGQVSRQVTLTNSGLAPVTFSTLLVAPPFTLDHNCPQDGTVLAPVLQPGQSCTLTISVFASSAGPITGILTVVTDAAGGSAEIPLTATGMTALTPLLRVEPVSMGFGDRLIGSASPTQQVLITNIGGAPATLGLTSSTIDFLISGSSCGGTLEPSASCTAQVAFRPLGFGTRTGSVVVTSNAPGSPQAVMLGGTGCRPFMASGNRIGDVNNCAP